MTRLVRPELVALATAAVLLVLALWWRRDPGAYPFGDGDRFRDMSLLGGVPAGTAVDVLTAMSAAMVVLASCLAATDRIPATLRATSTVMAVAAAVLFGYVVPDIQLLILTAYATTFVLPGLLVLAVCRRVGQRHPAVSGGSVPAWLGAMLPTAAVVAVLCALVLLVRPWTWGGEEAGQGSQLARAAVLGVSVCAGVAWGRLAWHLLVGSIGRDAGSTARRPRWTSPGSAARWGRVATWATALCPLPYVVTRLTWLTPWPYGESAEVLADNPGLRVFGLGLAAAGEFGTWLTLGLIRPRGEAFPGWVPRVGGRRVPVMAAVVPGLTVALLMTIGGHSVVQQAYGPGTTTEDHLLPLLVPLPVWGPLLAVSVVGYWLRRTPWPGGVGPDAPPAS